MLGIGRKRKLKKLMNNAANYKEWLNFALEYDLLDKKSENHIKFKGSINEDNIKNTIKTLKSFRNRADAPKLIDELKEAVYGFFDELTAPENYFQNTAGYPPYIVTDFLKTIEESLKFLCYEQIEGYSDQLKLKLFKDYYRNLGKSALLLSGGGALGIYHLGVVKALFFEDLLPDIIGGSSMGAIVGAGVCSRDRNELTDFLNHPEQIMKKAFRLRNPKRILDEKALFDSATLLHHVKSNMKGELTFKEAFEKTGLALNISVTPTRIKQKPRILNHITAPNVLISYATVASCAMPGLYKPSILMEKNPKNEIIPYLPSERWIDGTLGDDLPMKRISRLFNVNHYIVSQANPHVVPFMSMKHNADLRTIGFELAVSLASHQAQSVVKTLKKRLENKTGGLTAKHLNTLLSQNYLGDINIHPPFNPILYSKMLSNPDEKDLLTYIKLGEKSVWNKIKLIKDQTLLKRTFHACIKHLERKLEIENS